MGLITTQHPGFGTNKPKPEQLANPKPVTGFDYAGQPMRGNAFYNGRPEHMDPLNPEAKQAIPRHPSDVIAATPDVRSENRSASLVLSPARSKKLSAKEISARIRAGIKRAREGGQSWGNPNWKKRHDVTT